MRTKETQVMNVTNHDSSGLAQAGSKDVIDHSMHHYILWMSFLFSGKSRSGSNEVSREKVREWNRALQHQIRDLDKQIADIQRSEAKARITCKKAVKDGQLAGARILAREIVSSRKSVLKLHTAKANLNSIMSSLSSQVAMSRVISSLDGATSILEKMNELMKIDQVRDTVRDLSKELQKADLISETIDEGLESAFEEEAPEGEVQDVLNEILGPAKNVVGLPDAQTHAAAADSEAPSVSIPSSGTNAAEDEDDDDVVIDREQMQARFAALRASAT
jgi:charged multivesicular body protein 3